MSERGKYIVLEGGDNVGKTTQVEILAKAINGIKVREPGGTYFGEEIVRPILLDKTAKRVPDADVHLHLAARVQLIHEVINPTLSSGIHLIADRSWVSSAAYQGAQGVALNKITRINKESIGGYMKPDLLLVLDADPEKLKERAQEDEDYYEQMDIEFHSRVRENFIDLSHKLGGVVVDASASIEEVSQEIREVVADRLGI